MSQGPMSMLQIKWHWRVLWILIITHAWVYLELFFNRLRNFRIRFFFFFFTVNCFAKSDFIVFPNLQIVTHTNQFAVKKKKKKNIHVQCSYMYNHPIWKQDSIQLFYKVMPIKKRKQIDSNQNWPHVKWHWPIDIITNNVTKQLPDQCL